MVAAALTRGPGPVHIGVDLAWNADRRHRRACGRQQPHGYAGGRAGRDPRLRAVPGGMPRQQPFDELPGPAARGPSSCDTARPPTLSTWSARVTGCIEVYPHPATVSRFGLSLVLKYKRPGRDPTGGPARAARSSRGAEGAAAGRPWPVVGCQGRGGSGSAPRPARRRRGRGPRRVVPPPRVAVGHRTVVTAGVLRRRRRVHRDSPRRRPPEPIRAGSLSCPGV